MKHPDVLEMDLNHPFLSVHPLLRTHREVFQKLANRLPSPLETATAKTLLKAEASVTVPSSKTRAFKAVVAPTGAGKSVGTAALLAHRRRDQGSFSAAYVIQTVEECDAVYRLLRELLPEEDVAVYTSLHKENASPKALSQRAREQGLKIEHHFSEEQFRDAPIVICTHERWKREITSGECLGVTTWKGIPRTLVVIDEDPSLERVWVRQPEHVDELISVLSDTTLKDEARNFGFTNTHAAVEDLRSVHCKMRDIKDKSDLPVLHTNEMITEEEADSILSLTWDDLQNRLRSLPPDQYRIKIDGLWGTVQFLRAAIQGRFFYSRDEAGAFYAYDLAVPPQPHTIILDGTADLNSMYAIGSNVIPVTGAAPDYSQVDITYVSPPSEFGGKMRNKGILRTRWTAEPYMQWFRQFLIDHTKRGEKVLVYAKQRLLDYGLHKDPGDGIDSPYETIWEGRHVHFVNFGRGRGSNKWKDCTAYFRLGDFHQKKAVVLSKIGSVTGQAFSSNDLTRMSTGTTIDPMYLLARDAHLLVTNKQDAARICIRQFDNDGKAAKGRLYLIDVDFNLILSNLDKLFPGARELKTIGLETTLKTGTGQTKGPELLRNLLATTDEMIITGKTILEKTGIESKNIVRTLRSRKVSPVVEARGWRKVSNKEAGLRGKGWVLQRC